MDEKDPNIKQLIAQDKLERERKCEEELAAIFKKYECEFHTIQEYIDGRPGPIIIKISAK